MSISYIYTLLGSCSSHAFSSETSSVLHLANVRKGYFLAPHKTLSACEQFGF